MLGKTRQQLKRDFKKRAKNARTHAFRKLSPKQKMAFKKMQRASRKGGAVRKRIKSFKATKRRIGESHDLEFINAVIEHAVQEGNTDTAMKLLALPANFTSTDEGVYAVEIIEMLESLENEVGSNFLDVEIMGENIIAYFKKTKNDISEDITESISEMGSVEMLAKPGDAISETEVSDVYIFSILPKKTQLESCVNKLFTKKDLEEIDEAVKAIKKSVKVETEEEEDDDENEDV